MSKRWNAKPRSKLRRKRKPRPEVCYCEHCFPLDDSEDV